MKKSTWLSRAKDTALEKALVMLLRPKFERYGEVRQFALDTTEKTLSAEILLRGESAPLVISQARYRIETRGTDSYLVVHSVKVSREWLQNLLVDHFPEITLKIPEFVKALIK
ncbi:MAG: hypothetical protein QOJ40_2006 [Verrucomicrobiota bacterium]